LTPLQSSNFKRQSQILIKQFIDCRLQFLLDIITLITQSAMSTGNGTAAAAQPQMVTRAAARQQNANDANANSDQNQEPNNNNINQNNIHQSTSSAKIQPTDHMSIALV
jgi:hypothetical protein